eukprot:gene6038-53610_t
MVKTYARVGTGRVRRVAQRVIHDPGTPWAHELRRLDPGVTMGLRGPLGPPATPSVGRDPRRRLAAAVWRIVANPPRGRPGARPVPA